MATFHDFDPLALWGFLTSGRYVRCPPGRTLLAEGAPSTAYYLTINGAVEKVLVRGDRRIRVGLAGPGKAFGYESLIDGRPSPVTAITRERALLLVVPRDLFEQLFNGEDAVSRVFLDVIQRDLMATLRQTLRPCARLAASRVAPCPAGSPSPARSAARPRPARPRSRRAGTRSTRRWRRRPRSRSPTRTTAASAATCSPSCGARPRPVALNASGPAARAASAADQRTRGRRMPLSGPDPITVPGAVAGWGALHALGAARPWADAFAAAVAAAEDGFPIPRTLAVALTEHPDVAALLDVEDDALRQPALARTLRALAAHGPRELYEGETAARLAAGLQARGSRIDAADLAAFAPEETAALTARFRGLDLFTAPPNSSGVLLLQALAALDRAPAAGPRHARPPAARRHGPARGDARRPAPRAVRPRGVARRRAARRARARPRRPGGRARPRPATRSRSSPPTTAASPSR